VNQVFFTPIPIYQTVMNDMKRESQVTGRENNDDSHEINFL
jgi:hypothetical protein